MTIRHRVCDLAPRSNRTDQAPRDRETVRASVVLCRLCCVCCVCCVVLCCADLCVLCVRLDVIARRFRGCRGDCEESFVGVVALKARQKVEFSHRSTEVVGIGVCGVGALVGVADAEIKISAGVWGVDEIRPGG